MAISESAPLINRRELLVATASSMTLAALGPAALAQAGMVSAPTRADFEPLVGGQAWLLHRDTYSVGHAELVEIIDGPADPVLEQFTLLLASSGPELPDGLYWVVDRARHRYYVLHLELVGDDANGFSYYVAPFSLLR